MGAQELFVAPDSPDYSVHAQGSDDDDQEIIRSPVSANDAAEPVAPRHESPSSSSCVYVLEVLRRRPKTDPGMHNGSPSWVHAFTHSFLSEREMEECLSMYEMDEGNAYYAQSVRTDVTVDMAHARPLCSCCGRVHDADYVAAEHKVYCATCNLPKTYLCADCRKPVYTCQDAWLDGIYVCCHCARVALVDKPMAHTSSPPRFLSRRRNPLVPRRVKHTIVQQL